MFAKFVFELDIGKPCTFAQNELKFDTIMRGKPCMFVKKLIKNLIKVSLVFLPKMGLNLIKSRGGSLAVLCERWGHYFTFL